MRKTNDVANEVTEIPIACRLEPAALRGQLDDWQTMLLHATRRSPLADGVRVQFDAAAALDELMRLVAAEQRCCPFLRFAITVDTRGPGLEVQGTTAPARSSTRCSNHRAEL
jgi:hypothetical protein